MTITPFLMFEGTAEAAMNFYASLFPDATIGDITRFGPGGPGREGSVMQATMSLKGQKLFFFDSPVKHAFTFTPSISLMVDCDSAEEVDRLFTALSDQGKTLMPLDAYPFARRFAWVNDRFGVSWQLRFS
jgi:predicted 3-demethylubiquinone-9 3-methyltransferase (glyoxalase superfamily)